MANNQSAIKRHKQNKVRRMHNHAMKSAVRSEIKKYIFSVHENNAEQAKTLLQKLTSKLDNIARKGIIHPNTAARKKSRMQKLYNKTFA